MSKGTKKISLIFYILMFAFVCVFGIACNDVQSCNDGDCENTDGDIDEDLDLVDNSEDDVENTESNEEDTEVQLIMDGSMTGTWAMKFAIDYTTVLPLLDCKVQMLLSGVAKLKVDHNGKTLAFTEEICDMNMDIVEDIRFYVFFTDEIIAATGIQPRESQLSSLEVGADWTTKPAWDLYGVDSESMSDPENDPLPTEADDPLVVDFDKDGKPGLTTPICGFVGSCSEYESEVYVVMRMMRNMLGKVVSEKLITGSIDSSVEMITLGADPSYFAFQMNLQKYDDPNVNYFEMVKLDNDDSCNEILSISDEIFTFVPMENATPLWTEECPKEIN